MSTLKVDGIRSNSATSDAITLADNGTCTANITNNLSNRNLCINGADMLVAQRGTSTTGLQNSGGIYTIDRFSYRRSGTWSNAVFKHEQVNSGSGLFRKALKVTCTTAEGSVPSGTEAVMIGHYLEAQDTIAHFGDGTAEAKSFTVSFYVKASIATTYALQMMTAHLTTDKNFSKTFVVSSANTWERKTLTFPALTDSIGGALDVTSTGTGMMFTWMLDAVTGTVAADTFSNSGSHKLPSGVSTTGFSNTLNATFQLAGVQIEAGTVATDLEHRSYAQELALCQRYCQVYVNPRLRGVKGSNATDYQRLGMTLLNTLRASPSATWSGTQGIYDGGTSASLTGISVAYVDTQSFEMDGSGSGNMSGSFGAAIVAYKGSDLGTLTLSAEL
tara:strand:- start:141 stop:1304 length:1164 start_codon:yes stop_codon:yes gene_type:complete